jgi:hypothetical protein
VKLDGRTSSRVAGLMLGVTLAGVALRTWPVPAAGGRPGADVRMLAGPTGELDVGPYGPFLTATGLRPGTTPAQGNLAVRNETGIPRAVHLRALPSQPDLDSLLVVELTADGHPLFQGMLGNLRNCPQCWFPLASGERTVVGVRAWLPATSETGYEGRIEDVALELTAGKPGG